MTPERPDPDSDPAVQAVQTALNYLPRWVSYRVWHTRVPGAQVAVWFGGRRRFARSFGVADARTGDRLRNTHLFRIASHSKTFTATGILQLAEAGRLRLDDEVRTHVNLLADSTIGRVTVRELLSHSGGVSRDSSDGDFWALLRPFPDAETFDEMLGQDLDVTVAGHAFKYSNIGYSILGRVIESVSGRSYREYTDEHIVRPLRLRHTAAEVIDKPGAVYAAAHTGLHTSFDRDVLDNVRTGAMASATGFSSTASDLVRYAAGHFTGSGELLSDRSKRWMRQPLWQPDPSDADAGGYGLGLSARRVRGRTMYGHGGGWPGHSTRTLWEPEIGLAVSVLTNAIDGPADELAVGITEILLASLERSPDPLRLRSGHDVTVHGAATRGPDPAAATIDIGRFAGRYASAWALVDIAPIGDRLYLLPPAAPAPMDAAEPLTVIDENTLRMDSGSGFGSIGELIHVEFGVGGRVRRLRAGSGMTMRPAPRPTPYRQTSG